MIRYHQPKKITDEENTIKALAISQIPFGFKPFDDAIIIHRLEFVFPPLKSFSKIKRMQIAEGMVLYKTTKPDLNDNLCKGLFDALEGVLYLNDSQICEKINTRKVYGLRPGITLEVEGFYENNKSQEIKTKCYTEELAL